MKWIAPLVATLVLANALPSAAATHETETVVPSALTDPLRERFECGTYAENPTDVNVWDWDCVVERSGKHDEET